jgi:prolyl oligopeptidase
MKISNLRRPVLIGALAALSAAIAWAQADDPYIWLEDAHGAKAMAWVEAENAKTTGVLEKDARYAGMYRDALAIAESQDRIPAPDLLAGSVYNFWQDPKHVRGIWRKTSLASYASADPQWSTVLDLDALAAAEKANWFLKQTTCTEPIESHCLLSLSDGGEDAVTVREFDLKSAAFPAAGFTLPKGKQRVAWENDDTLLVAREWQPGELTTAGYPFIVKRVKRGQPLSAAKEVFRGSASDTGYGVMPQVLWDGAGNRAVLLTRRVTTFESENDLVAGDKVAKLALPKKIEIQALVDGQVVISLAEDWTVAGKSFKSGSLVAFDLKSAARDPEQLKVELIYAPGPRETFDDAHATRDALLITTFDNVRGRAWIYRHGSDGSWKRTQVGLPDNTTIEITSTDLHSDHAFLTVSGYLQPPTLWGLDTKTGVPATVKQLPAKFDASKETVEQFEVSSSDGTRIPYFVMHPAAMPLDGSNPTILYAYGGFQVPLTPAYAPSTGKLWLEKGGVFVEANIRGGGEFGPAWHDAGLKTHRQIIYDDFSAVARDLIARKITSPRHLGIQGGSNGGLLMGVEFTQHPELWNAVDIQVPLLDMVRFEKIAAGSSWIGEYGSMANPDEAAFLTKISPYANIHRGTSYPEAFIWTTSKDDRVGPQHARKFAARLSEYGIPYLYYEVVEGGHGAGANLAERAHTTALEMTYFARKLMD